MSTLELVIIGACAGFLVKHQLNWPINKIHAAAIGLGGAMMGTGLAQALVADAGYLVGVGGSVAGAVALVWVWQRQFGNTDDAQDSEQGE